MPDDLEVLPAVDLDLEVVPPRSEYADAGIPHCSTVDLDDGPSPTVRHLAGESGHQDSAPERGVLVTGTPLDPTVTGPG